MKENNKKILFITPYFKPHTGGLENYVANIEKGLREFGWTSIIITSNDIGRPYSEEIIDGAKVYRLKTLFKIFNTPVNPLWYFQLKKIFKKENPALINAHAPVPFLADMSALAAGNFPFVLTYHSGTMKKRRLFPDIIIDIYEKFLLLNTARKAKRIICPSNFVISTLLHKFKNKSIVITPGVDTAIFKPGQNTNYEKNVVLFIARFANMYRMKGFYYLLEAIKKMPHLTLKVIGEPISLNIPNVVFWGSRSTEETAQEIQKCSVLVLPSLAHMESFGMVLIEAMACKKPVIGTNIGGIPEIICHGVDGIIIPPSNVNALAIAIDQIIKDHELANFLSNNGFNKATSLFNWRKKVEETAMEFSALIGY